MMNKSLIILGLVLAGFFSGTFINHSYAQEYTQDDLKDVVVRFCDKMGDLIFKQTINAEPGKESKVRFCIYNNSEKKIPITYGFNTAVYNGVGTRVCQEKTSTANNDFPLIPEKKDRTIIMDPLGSIMIEEDVVIPPGMATGIQMGCLTAEVGGGAIGINVGAMFVLKVRKAFDLDIVIGGMAAIQNTIKVLNTTGGAYSTNKKVKVEVDKENNLKLGFSIENNGNISQTITITGKVYNVLGFQKEFVATGKTIVPTSTNEFIVDVGLLPAYKGLFSVKFNIQNNPQFIFPVSDEELKKSGYIEGKANVFVFSRIRVAALCIVILIIYRFFVPKKTKVITITVPAPPTPISTPVSV